jgi:decaprenyl-phosphate phosphoribosyltransferase
MRRLSAYLRVCRPDHWFKNVFVLAGTAGAVLIPGEEHVTGIALATRTIEALVVCCLAASANYVVNELLDAERDALHPVKCHRPVPSGLVEPRLLWALAAGLAFVALAWSITSFPFPFAVSVALLLLQGFVYNVPPIRTKEVAYLDVLSESVNNPIRLLIGWYATGRTDFPPMLVFLGYWVVGAFLMTAKRYAEFRFLADRERAIAYRSSFAGYSEESLLIAMICYASLSTFLFGLFLSLHQEFELILALPFLIGFLAWFFHLAFRPDSIVKEPERLWEEGGFAAYCAFLFVLLIALASAELGLLEAWSSSVGFAEAGDAPR